jgi:hypothetical protein
MRELRPYRAWISSLHRIPGRCPGLVDGRPVGAPEVRSPPDPASDLRLLGARAGLAKRTRPQEASGLTRTLHREARSMTPPPFARICATPSATSMLPIPIHSPGAESSTAPDSRASRSPPTLRASLARISHQTPSRERAAGRRSRPRGPRPTQANRTVCRGGRREHGLEMRPDPRSQQVAGEKCGLAPRLGSQCLHEGPVSAGLAQQAARPLDQQIDLPPR